MPVLVKTTTVGELREFTFTEPKLTALGLAEAVALADEANKHPIISKLRTAEHTRSIDRILFNFLLLSLERNLK